MLINDPNEKNIGRQRNLSITEELDGLDDGIDHDKMKVECICPKCGIKHVMNFHWIGRGTPRKFCPPCKGSKD
jgi:hypothetical protein